MAQVTRFSFQQLMQHWRLFWTLMLYGMLLICIGTMLSEGQATAFELGSSLVLASAFLAAYHIMFLSRLLQWPKPLPTMLIYFCIQFLLIVLLMHIDRIFGLLCYSLLFHIAGSLRLAYWPIPMLGASALIAIMMGADQMVIAGEWVTLLGTVLYLLIWPAIALFIYLMINQRYRMQHLIDELHQAQATLTQHAQQAEELATLRERSRLARDMHDSIGHALVLINVKLEAAQRLYALDAQRGAHELETTRDLIRSTMRELRQSLANLRTAPELEQGLLPALLKLAETSAQRSGVDIKCCLPEFLPDQAAIVHQALWRIAREALTNIERHAQAQHATLSLEQQERTLLLRICDDGQGMAQEDMVRSGHFGILGMHEIAQQAGGFVDIRAGEQGGTCVTCTITVGSYDTNTNTRADR